jgi:Tfp pilus assembly PilM family ATPase
MAKSPVVLGIELTPPFIKSALIDHSGPTLLYSEIRKSDLNPFENVSDVEIAIQDMLAKAPGKKKDVQVVVSISSRQSVLRFTEVPLDAQDDPDYLKWEFESVINSPAEEYYFDYHVLGPASRQISKAAVLAGFRKILIDQFLEGFFEKSSLPQIIDIDVFALLNAFEYAEPVAYSKSSVLVKTGYNQTILIFAEGGVPFRLHTVSTRDLKPETSGQDRQSLMQKYVGEIHLLLVKDFKPSDLGGVYVCGDFVGDTAFQNALKQCEGITYNILDTYEKLKIDAEGNEPAIIPQCATAIGTALRFKGDKK